MLHAVGCRQTSLVSTQQAFVYKASVTRIRRGSAMSQSTAHRANHRVKAAFTAATSPPPNHVQLGSAMCSTTHVAACLIPGHTVII